MTLLKAKHVYIFIICITILSCHNTGNKSHSEPPQTKYFDTLTIRQNIPQGNQDTVYSLSQLADTILDDTALANPQGFTSIRKSSSNNTFIHVIDKKEINYKKLKIGISALFSPGESDDKFIFRGKTTFNDCVIMNYTSRPGIDKVDDYTGPSIIDNAIFSDTLILSNNKYFYPIHFINDRFKEKLFIYNTSTDTSLIAFKPPVFNGNIFENGVVFNSHHLNNEIGVAYVKDFVFKTDLLLSDCRFSGNLNLSGCTFSNTSTLVFERTNLPDTINLSDVKLTNSIDLTNSATLPNLNSHKCELVLLNMDATKIKMQYQNFHLCFPDSVLKDPNKIDLISNTYQNLLANFKTNGYDNSFVTLDIEFKDWQSTHNLFVYIDNLWWKYGYEKWRIVLWSMLFLLLFTILNHLLYNKLITTYTIQALNTSEIETGPSKRRTISGFIISFFYTSFIFFKLSLDFDKINFKNHSLIFLLLIEYSLGLLCTGYLLNWVLSK